MFKILRVRGSSLSPEYQDGDFVLVSKIPVLLRRLRPGDVVAFNQPEHGIMIKKIAALSPDGREMTVLGRHPWSIDSRSFGPVQLPDILGKVVFHIRKA